MTSRSIFFIETFLNENMVRDPCSPLMGRRLKTREQADIIISLDLWSLDVA